MTSANQFHTAQESNELVQSMATTSKKDTKFTYKFENFFHPFVGELIAKLNSDSLPGLLDAKFHEELGNRPSSALPGAYYEPDPENSPLVEVQFHNKNIDLEGGPYANYNWELLFHIPLSIAVYLSKNQRFPEAQRWFHYIFDPTDPEKKYWKFLAFLKSQGDETQIDELLMLLSTPDNELDEPAKKLKESILQGYLSSLAKPFMPHAVARTGARQLAYQYCVVMKYLDNLIAWGDHLFRQDTVESINEATQLYVLAANILGARPQRIPPGGSIRPKTFAQLKAQGLDPMGNAHVELEGEFPFNFGLPQTQVMDPEATGPLFGIRPTLYFCIPRNEKLLSYWDTVADRLFKIRHCMNIEGVVRQLQLFDPPIDPGMLVKAAAAGIDIGSIISGLNQPISAVRSLFFIQKALELAGEVRGLGSALLSAIEKGDSERLALLRQGHEIKIQQMAREVRFLQWKQAEEATESLLRSRVSALEKYRYYLRLLGQTRDTNAAPDTLALDRQHLTEENFDEAHAALVEQYEKAIPQQPYPPLSLAGETSPANQSLLAGQGKLYLNQNEDKELNEDLPESRAWQDRAQGTDVITAALYYIPSFHIKAAYWGIGSGTKISGGEFLGNAGRAISSSFKRHAENFAHDASAAAKTASYERRADEWRLGVNQAAHELAQIGRQIIGSLIAEQIAYRDYQNIQSQIEQSQAVDQELREKFSDEKLYLWMQGEITRLYYEYYRFAFDTARRAEQTMKRELMRPELDATDYVKFNYWDGGRKGLLSGEALYLDVKRMEMAYHEHNKREYELTKHVSLRQLDPVALLTLKASGSCEVSLPEWLFDLDGPGHYMRRIKNVGLSIPAVTGPYTSLNCTVSLLKSSLRKTPLLKDDEYVRQGSEDDRFMDYFGTIQSVVTSSGNNDSGLFEANLRDERFLPFEGAGAESTWKLELPADFRQFDYNTISDIILHLRYTARPGGAQLRNRAVESLQELVGDAAKSGLTMLLSLKHDFPTEWHQFLTGSGNFTAQVKRDYFPYFTQGKQIVLDALRILRIRDGQLNAKVITPQELDLTALTDALNDEKEFELSLAPDAENAVDAILIRDKDAYVFAVIKYSMQPA